MLIHKDMSREIEYLELTQIIDTVTSNSVIDECFLQEESQGNYSFEKMKNGAKVISLDRLVYQTDLGLYYIGSYSYEGDHYPEDQLLLKLHLEIQNTDKSQIETIKSEFSELGISFVLTRYWYPDGRNSRKVEIEIEGREFMVGMNRVPDPNMPSWLAQMATGELSDITDRFAVDVISGKIVTAPFETYAIPEVFYKSLSHEGKLLYRGSREWGIQELFELFWQFREISYFRDMHTY